MRILIPLLLLTAGVLFVLGVVSPARSRRAQRGVERPWRHVERKSDRHAGRVGDWVSAMFSWTRRGMAKAAEAGRTLRKKLGS